LATFVLKKMFLLVITYYICDVNKKSE